MESLISALKDFAELGWVAVAIAIFAIAWKPTMGFLTVINTNKVNHAEKLIATLQKELEFLREEVKHLRKEVEDWRRKAIEAEMQTKG